METSLSPKLLLLLDELIRNSINGVVYVSLKELAKKFKVSERTIARYIDTLIKEGYLTRIGRGRYRINPLPHKHVTNLINMSLSNINMSSSEVLQPVTGKSNTPVTPDVLILYSYLASSLAPQSIKQFISSIIRYYRVHNVVVYVPLNKGLDKLYKLPDVVAGGMWVAQIFSNKKVIVLQSKSDWRFDVENHSITDVLYFLMRLPYLVASDIEEKLFVGVDYGNVGLRYFELAIVFKDGVNADIIEDLAYQYLVIANRGEIQVDWSKDNLELEFRGKDFKLLMEMLSMLSPLLLLEFVKYDVKMDEKILSLLLSLKQEIEEIKKKLEK